jgi:hypothetical protein
MREAGPRCGINHVGLVRPNYNGHGSWGIKGGAPEVRTKVMFGIRRCRRLLHYRLVRPHAKAKASAAASAGRPKKIAF